MTVKVQIEGGGTIEFPDDVTPDVVRSTVQKYSGAGTPEPDNTGMAEYGTGLMRQASHGVPVISPLVNKATAAMQASTHLLRPGPGISHATGSGSALNDWLQRYSEDLDRENQQTSQFQQKYPKASAAAQMVGGATALAPIAATGAGATALGLGGRTLASQIGRSAVSGGAISGLDEVLRGGSLKDVATAAGMGTGVGALVPPVGRALSTLTSPITSTVRALTRPSDVANEMVAGAVQRGQAAGIPEQTLTPAEQAQHGTMVGTMAGAPGEDLLRWSTNISSEGRGTAERAIDQQFRTQAERLADHFQSTLHYPDETARRAAIQDVRENVYEPAYTQAYRSAANKPLWPDPSLTSGVPRAQKAALQNLKDLVQAPEVQTAIRNAVPMLRNWAVRDGLRPPSNPFVIRPNAHGTPETIMAPGGPLSAPLPSLQLWDYIKRSLDRMGTPTAQMFSRSLRDSLDALVPEYRDARTIAQPIKVFGGARDAYEAGGNYVGKAQQFGQPAIDALRNMTPQELALFQDGYTQNLINKVNATRDRLNVINSIANSNSARAEIQAVVGPQRYAEIEARIRLETIMDRMRGALGNSTTARQLLQSMAIGSGIEGAAALATGHVPTTDALLAGVLLAGMRGGRIAANQRVAQQVAELLTSTNPARVHLGMQSLTRNEGLMNALRAGSNILARAGTGAAVRNQMP